MKTLLFVSSEAVGFSASARKSRGIPAPASWEVGVYRVSLDSKIVHVLAVDAFDARTRAQFMLASNAYTIHADKVDDRIIRVNVPD